jgi:carboxyl-terminal processing protease
MKNKITKKVFASTILINLVLVSCGTTASTVTSSIPSEVSQISSEVISTSTSQASTSEEQSVSSSVISSSSTTSISSTTSSSVALSSQDRINLDLAALNYSLGGAMPSFGANGTTISWTSSHPSILSGKGAYVALPIGAEDIEVTLTARVSHGGLSNTKEFRVNAQPPESPVLTIVRELPFINTSEEYLVTDQPLIEVYFTETGTVPYMDTATFFNMIDGAIDFSLLEFEANQDILTISYTLEDVDSNDQPISFSYEAILDFEANTITVDDFSFFSNYVLSTETNFSEGLSFLGGIGLNSNSVTIPLGDYRVDLVRRNDEYLMPIAILNLLFMHSQYYDVYYNGDEIYGFDTFTALDSESTVLTEMKTSSFNSLNMQKDLRQSTYHFLALAFDYFYGLKEDKNIETFYDVLAGYNDRILTGNDRSLYSALFSFAYGLDDLHTWHEATGFYEPNSYKLALTSIGQLGRNSQNYYTGSWALEDLMEEVYGVDNLPPASRLLDNDTIAVITLTGFTVDTPNIVNDILKVLPETVESVIIDLSFNGGGNLGAVLRLFGYITEEPIQYSSMNPVDGSAATYFYESSYVAYDYDWYVMTSSVTFSAANLMTAMAKEMGVATVIGTQSSGGAASIGLFVTPDGTMLLRSTLNVLATVTVDENENRTYTSVEAGVPVDYELTNPFNNDDITALINQIRRP